MIKIATLTMSLLFLHIPFVESQVVLREKDEKVVTVKKKDQSSHAEHEVLMRKIPDREHFFELLVKGNGNYAQFKGVQWESYAEIFEKEGRVFIGKTTTSVFSEGIKVFESQKRFNYESKVVSLKIFDEKGAISRSEEFPIRGPICDDVTLVHIFPWLVSGMNLNKPESFYLITNEPKLYRVMVKYRGSEVLSVGDGTMTNKFQLMADLGPLTEMVSKIVPPTFVWYAENSYFDWYQYEGMESGYKSENIRSFVVKK